MRTPILPSLIALLALLLPPALALGQDWNDDEDEEEEGVVERVIYQYTDDQGVTYLVDDLNRVPLQYRTESRLREIRQRESLEEDDERPPKDPPDPSERRPPEEEEDAGEEPEKVVPPAERIAELEARRVELRERMALLEEGYSDPGVAEMDPEQLSKLLEESEGELTRIEDELKALREK